MPSDRRYGRGHQQRRRLLAGRVAAGKAVCWRCNKPILPGEAWDLGHADDSNSYGGPEHRACNRGQPAREAWAARAASKAGRTRKGIRWSRHWYGSGYDERCLACRTAEGRVFWPRGLNRPLRTDPPVTPQPAREKKFGMKKEPRPPFDDDPHPGETP
jgi:hypothetical protein